MKQDCNRKLCQVPQSGGPHQAITVSIVAQGPVCMGQNNSLLPKNMKTEQVRGPGALLMLKSADLKMAQRKGSTAFPM